MLARLERFDRECPVQMERRGDHDRVEILADEFVEILVAGHVQLIANLVKTVLEIVADCRERKSGSLRRERFPAQRAKNAHANLPGGNGFVHMPILTFLYSDFVLCTIIRNRKKTVNRKD